MISERNNGNCEKWRPLNMNARIFPHTIVGEKRGVFVCAGKYLLNIGFKGNKTDERNATYCELSSAGYIVRRWWFYNWSFRYLFKGT
jgi:hypothetical protein